ncbi:MAG: hypothetical protein ACK5N0_11440 [Synechococcaceae cyanobacterium]
MVVQGVPEFVIQPNIALCEIAIHAIVEIGWMILVAMVCFAATRWSSVPLIMVKSHRAAPLPLGMARGSPDRMAIVRHDC